MFPLIWIPTPLPPNYHKLTREREGVEPIRTTAKKRGPLPCISFTPQANELRKMVRELLQSSQVDGEKIRSRAKDGAAVAGQPAKDGAAVARESGAQRDGG